MQNSEIEQLRARLQLLLAERNELAKFVISEQRPFTNEELKRIRLLDGAITAISNVLLYYRPPSAPPSQEKLAPNRSEPGSDYRVIAAAFYEQSRDNWRAMNQLVADYGKWMIATISAVHLGGIYFIGGINEISLSSKEGALWALVSGLILIFLCALTTYYNWQFGAAFYASRTNVNSLVDPTALPTTKQSQLARIDITYLIAIILGVLSVACIPLSAYLLSTAAHAAQIT